MDERSQKYRLHGIVYELMRNLDRSTATVIAAINEIQETITIKKNK
ncbi:MAG TPA: hypothetical protein VEI95_17255 [Acidobacteriota bacterium]|nr:hypothetical protein [Acidobacteriota bacterium]